MVTNVRIVVLLGAMCLIVLSGCDQHTPAELTQESGSPAPALHESPTAAVWQATATAAAIKPVPTVASAQQVQTLAVTSSVLPSERKPPVAITTSVAPQPMITPETPAPTETIGLAIVAAAVEPPPATTNSEPPAATTAPAAPTPTPAPPTPTPAPTATSTPAPPTRDPNCPKAMFVADITVPDNSWISPGEAFVKTWRVSNAGNCVWPSGTHLAFWSGDSLGAPAGATVVGAVEVGQTTDISLRMIAPDMDGAYQGVWGLFDESGEVFGLLLTAVIQVGVPTPEPPPPTDTPEPATPTATLDAATPTAVSSEAGTIEEGFASYYSPSLDGTSTASGEIYRNDLLTAAHRTLEFGTRVRVTNKRNGKSVEVVINDRGPFSRKLFIDVSYRAAQELDMISAGIVRATIEVLE